MYDLQPQELTAIDKELKPKLDWAEQNKDLAEQLAMDATRLMSCTEERLDEYKDKGFFNRCWASFSGKNAQMQRANQKDLIQMQKMGFRYLQMLNERDILMAHSLITIKNNLNTLAIDELETREEITKLAQKVKQRFDELTLKIGKVEETANISQWLGCIDVGDYDERFPKYIRMLVLINEFRALKGNNWTTQDIRSLQKALKEAQINRKEKIKLEDFICNLFDEIKEYGLNDFNKEIKISTCKDKPVEIGYDFIQQEISSPVFLSLYEISDKYRVSNDVGKEFDGDDIAKKLVLAFIRELNVDISKEVVLQDLALEILNCGALVCNIYSIEHKEETDNNIIDIQEAEKHIDNSTEEQKLEDLELSLIPNKLSVSYNDFGLFIDKENKAKSFSLNTDNSKYMGIGTWQTTVGKNYYILDLPKHLECISVSVGYKHSLALLEDGSVYAWGDSEYGQLGDNTKDSRLSAFKVIGLPKDIKPVKIVAGLSSSFVLMENGDLYACGTVVDSCVFILYYIDFKISDFELMCDEYNEKGLVFLDKNRQMFVKRIRYSDFLDEISYNNDNKYIAIKGLPENAKILQVEVGSKNIYVLTDNNEIYSVGDNEHGQLGIPNRERGVMLTSFTKIYGISGKISSIHTVKENSKCFGIAVTNNAYYGWGDNSASQLGKKDNYYTTSFETGIIFKDRHYTEHYYEPRPKKIKEIEYSRGQKIVCSNGKVYILNDKSNKIDILGGMESFGGWYIGGINIPKTAFIKMMLSK